jgi:molecular chaperone GrpE (heat shock protein)
MDDDVIGRRLDSLGRQIEEIADDNTAFVTELRRLDRSVAALRDDLTATLAIPALRDVCVELIDPLEAVDRLLGDRGNPDPELMRRHVRSVATTLRGVLRRMGAEVEPIVLGEELYDPHRHRCVGVVDPRDSPFPAAPPDTVVRVIEDGYVLQRRPLRPALVEVQGDGNTAGES